MLHLLFMAVQLVVSLILLAFCLSVLADLGKWALAYLIEGLQVATATAMRVSVAWFKGSRQFTVQLLKRLTVRGLRALGRWLAALYRATLGRGLAWLAEKADAALAAVRDFATKAEPEEPKASGTSGAGRADETPRSPYEEALDLLGLLGVQPLTRDVLKRRYAELIRIVHPDKGFPNRVFAQQINDAVSTIKRHHNWR